MKNQTQQIQTIHKIDNFPFSLASTKIIDYQIALNEYTNNDDYMGFLSKEVEPYEFMSLESMDQISI